MSNNQAQDDNDSQDDKDSTSIIQSSNKKVNDRSYSEIERFMYPSFLDSCKNITLEERVAYALSFNFFEQVKDYSRPSVKNTERQMTDFLRDIYKILKTLDIVINPNDTTRDIIDVIMDHKIVSAKMVCHFSLGSKIRSKTTALNYLRGLERAKILERKSPDPIISSIKKPLASIHRTELYGFPGIEHEEDYASAIDFYSGLTQEAYITERVKAETDLIRKELEQEVKKRKRLTKNIERLEQELRTNTLTHFFRKNKEKELKDLQQELEGLDD